MIFDLTDRAILNLSTGKISSLSYIHFTNKRIRFFRTLCRRIHDFDISDNKRSSMSEFWGDYAAGNSSDYPEYDSYGYDNADGYDTEDYPDTESADSGYSDADENAGYTDADTDRNADYSNSDIPGDNGGYDGFSRETGYSTADADGSDLPLDFLSEEEADASEGYSTADTASDSAAEEMPDGSDTAYDKSESRSDSFSEKEQDGVPSDSHNAQEDNRDHAHSGRGSKRKVPAGRIAAGIIAALAVVYVIFAVYFMNHFGFRTSVNGHNVSTLSADAAISRLTKAAEDYTLTIHGRNDLTDTISASDIHLTSSDEIQQIGSLISKSRALIWPASLLKPTEYTTDSFVSYDGNALQQRISSLTFFDSSNVTEPQDAQVVYENGNFTIKAESEGSSPDAEKTSEAITAAIDGLNEQLDLDKAGCYKTPSVTKDDPSLTEQIEVFRSMANMNITLTFGDSKEVIDGGQVSKWLRVEDGKASFDTDAIKTYVDSLAEKYNTYGKKRSFTTNSGKTIEITAGSYGWLLDEDGTVTAITDALSAGSDTTIEPVWTQKAAQFGDNDIGTSYAEVDLDDQHVWIYKDGKVVVSTDCVSGKAINGCATPDGIYSIMYKVKDTNLRGAGYVSHVNYWMPFNGGVGFHDATWRSSFGGKIYIGRGSHGCVNLPLEYADDVFANVDQGTPVIVYGGMDQDEAVAYAKDHDLSEGTSTSTDTEEEKEVAITYDQVLQAQQAAQTAQTQAAQLATAAAADPANTETAVAAQQAAAAAQAAVDSATQIANQYNAQQASGSTGSSSAGSSGQ